MVNKQCIVDGCENNHYGLGYCQKHYIRVKKYGDPSVVKYNSKHGMYSSKLYSIWVNMKTRCLNKNATYYNNYGGRGIAVCKEWRDDFKAFYKDMGDIPFNGAQIDRIDNDKGYFKENCRWVTQTAQNRNRRNNKLSLEKAREIRNSFDKRKNTYREFAEKYGVDKTMIGLIIRNVEWKETLK